jgi:hypothetical protein
MQRERLTIITTTIRPAGALEAARSVQQAHPHPLDIRHVIAYWPEAPDPDCGPVRAAWISDLFRQAHGGWLLWVDDDNRLHPDLPARLAELTRQYPDARAFVFDCQYPQAHQSLLRAAPGMVRPGSIDGGQVVLWWELAGRTPWPVGECHDGHYLRALYEQHKDAFVFVSEPLTYHNHQAWAETSER